MLSVKAREATDTIFEVFVPKFIYYLPLLFIYVAASAQRQSIIAAKAPINSRMAHNTASIMA